MGKAALCFFAALSHSLAQSVYTVDENVFFRSAADSITQITSEHLDSDPSLSFDHKQIVFVRRTPDYLIDTGLGATDVNELWIAPSDGSKLPRRVLRGRAGSFEATERLTLAALGKPQFSPDGNRVYFTAGIWATSSAIEVLDLNTAVTRFLFPGLDVEVIHDGKYNGFLIGTKDPITDRGRIIVYWLFDSNGKEIKRIGENESDLEMFRESLRSVKQ